VISWPLVTMDRNWSWISAWVLVVLGIFPPVDVYC
jgi:hypothetical protein